MKKLRMADIASLMMLIWLAFYIFAATLAVRWADFVYIIACGVPMVFVKQKYRGATFGSKDCNTIKYKKYEYLLCFLLCICGTAILSALTYLFMSLCGTLSAVATSRSDIPYLIVFSCLIPAFFEEWLLRGGVLGALSQHGREGVWMCAVLFMLMHINPATWIYTLFAGIIITSLVYLTECIYLGMLLHLANNLTSLLLSLLPSGVAEYVALCLLALAFAICFALFRGTRLCTDMKDIVLKVDGEKLRELVTPLFLVFVLAVILINLI